MIIGYIFRVWVPIFVTVTCYNITMTDHAASGKCVNVTAFVAHRHSLRCPS